MGNKIFKYIIVLGCTVFAIALGSYYMQPGKQKKTGMETSKKELTDNAQDDAAMAKSNHLKFKGVPIDGTLEEFVERMKRRGFSKDKMKDGIATLNGDFADFKECMVYVETLNEKDLVSRITVAFPPQDQWKALYGDYKHLKELLTEKYGKPGYCIEKFEELDGFEPYDDSSRILHVKLGGCRYESRYTTDKGDVILAITYNKSRYSSYVTLVYEDKINGHIIKEHAKDDL